MENVYCANNTNNKAGVAILILSELDFKAKNISRDKEGTS